MYSRILWGRAPGIVLEFLILMMFLCVLTGEGKEEKKDSRGGLGLDLGLNGKNELSLLELHFIWVT